MILRQGRAPTDLSDQLNKIGFMQGRLSELIDGKIQAFPVHSWAEEFGHANSLGLSILEWTLDHEGLGDNPFMSVDGREDIRALERSESVAVASVTGDCFMQAPFWKARSSRVEKQLVEEFCSVIEACGAMETVRIVVVPLVDEGALDTQAEADKVIEIINKCRPKLAHSGVRVAFEMDYDPKRLAGFIHQVDPDVAGVNYDIGNSAALGFLPQEELRAYGDRVINVHVKDRPLNGSTCPLGQGMPILKRYSRCCLI